MARMRILTSEGIVDADVSEEGEASSLGGYWSAIGRYLNTGDSSRIDAFSGLKVAGKTLLTDLDAIDEEARRGELDFDDIYE